jgi:hypothetical protein
MRTSEYSSVGDSNTKNEWLKMLKNVNLGAIVVHSTLAAVWGYYCSTDAVYHAPVYEHHAAFSHGYTITAHERWSIPLHTLVWTWHLILAVSKVFMWAMWDKYTDWVMAGGMGGICVHSVVFSLMSIVVSGLCGTADFGAFMAVGFMSFLFVTSVIAAENSAKQSSDVGYSMFIGVASLISATGFLVTTGSQYWERESMAMGVSVLYGLQIASIALYWGITAWFVWRAYSDGKSRPIAGLVLMRNEMHKMAIEIMPIVYSALYYWVVSQNDDK